MTIKRNEKVKCRFL